MEWRWILVVLSVASAPAVARAQPATIAEAGIGDVDGDNLLTNSDLRAFQQQRLGRTPLIVGVTDLNGDGMVDASDQQLCTRAVLGIPTPMRLETSSVPESGTLRVVGAHLDPSDPTLSLSVQIEGATLPPSAISAVLSPDANAAAVSVGLDIQVDAATPDTAAGGPENLVISVGGETFVFADFQVQRTASLNISSVDVQEPADGGMVTVSVTVTLDRPALEPYAFELGLMGGTATPGLDVRAGPVQVSVLTGQLVGTANLEVLGDALFEGPETLSVVLMNPTPATAVRVNPAQMADVLTILDGTPPVPQTTLVSVAETGNQAGSGSSAVRRSGRVMSSDGRFVVFDSAAANLVPGDSNGRRDVFVRDLQTGQTTLVSRASTSGGALGNGDSFDATISADGRVVAFRSSATNLIVGGSSGQQIFARDLMSLETELLSRATGVAGAIGNDSAFSPELSGDGAVVVFRSDATNLIPGGTSGPQIFVRDRMSDLTQLMSRATGAAGAIGGGASVTPSISGDGRLVVFRSTSTNLVGGVSGVQIYLRDRVAETTVAVSRSDGISGVTANSSCSNPEISLSGRVVAFHSAATNLVSGSSGTQIFVRELDTFTTTLSSAGLGGVPGNGASQFAALSADGRFVVFSSFASNLVAGDSNAAEDVFVRDRVADVTARLSLTSAGGQIAASSGFGTISPNGRAATFSSAAAGVTATADTNAATDVFATPVTRP